MNREDEIETGEIRSTRSNMSFNDLTTGEKTWMILGNVLVLGPTFCLQMDKIKIKNPQAMIDRINKWTKSDCFINNNKIWGDLENESSICINSSS